MRRHPVARFLLFTLGVLFLILVMLVLAVLWAGRSEGGTAWVLDQVPGLAVDNGRGTLLDFWEADALSWQGLGVTVMIEKPYVDWSPSCLLEKRLCVNGLRAQRVVLELPESDSAGGGGIDLPTVNLPLAIQAAEVNIGEFTVNANRIWEGLRFNLNGSGADWILENLDFEREGLMVSASGRLTTRRDWPLALEAAVDLPYLEPEKLSLALDLSGSIEDLVFRGTSAGYLAASFQGRTQPLKEELPAQLTLNSARFDAAGAMPSPVVLNQIQLRAGGSLARGFNVTGKARIPAGGFPSDVNLQGKVTTGGVSGLQMRVVGQSDTQKFLSLSGGLNWEQGLSSELSFTLDGYPWYRLVPDMEPPPVDLNNLEGSLVYQDERYDGRLNAEVSGPLGDASLSTQVAGDHQSVSLQKFALETPGGLLGGDAKLDFASGFGWQTDLTLTSFNPGYWYPLAESTLNGRILSSGKLREQGLPDFNADWDIEGVRQSEFVSSRGKAEARSGQITISEFDAALAENWVRGQGSWGNQINATLSMDVPEPEKLLKDLSGTITADLRFQGTPEKPSGSLSARARDLSFAEQFSVARLELGADLDRQQRLEASLESSGLESYGEVLERLAVSLTGDRENHRLSVIAGHEEATLELAFAGGADESWRSWRGQLTKGTIDVFSQEQYWQLENAADLSFLDGQSVVFGAHCWRWDSATVCADQQTLWPEPDLDYVIREFPTSAFSHWMPSTFDWDGRLNAQLQFRLTETGPSGKVSVESEQGDLRWLVAEGWETLHYDRMRAAFDLLPDRARSELSVIGPKLGQLDVDLSIDPYSEALELEGNFRLSDLDLALASAVVEYEEIGGVISGSGTLRGPLFKPEIYGQLVLSDGVVSDSTLPIPLNELSADLTLEGNRAVLGATWTSNARSRGFIDGAFDWFEGPELELRVRGERLPITYEPIALLEVEPDITLRFVDGSLSINGDVAVPRGSINVDSIPSQAVSVSDDEVLIDEPPEEPAVKALNMLVSVIVGKDEVTFSAFGVQGDLEGTLRIGNEMDTRGSLQLVNGQYDAYGQELTLRRARIIFTGPLAEPYLDVEAIREVDTVVAGIRLSGPVKAPITEIFSEPPMAQNDALSYLVLGRPPQSQGDEGQMRNAAISMGLTQASKVTRGIGEQVGISDLTLEAEGQGDEAAVVASGRLSDDLSIRYGVGMFEPISTVALRYDLGRYFYLEAASGLAASLDLFYTRNF